jgi:UDP-N-acetylmuramate--alanine ligase
MIMKNTEDSMTDQFKHIHFIGIKGVGMSALAIVAQGMGYVITGSDVDEEFITDSSLKDAGITPSVGFAAEHIGPNVDLVVLGTAFGSDNPEVNSAKLRGITTWTYSELLGWISKQKKTIAVAGTHGKTTTTAILSFLLAKAGLDPSWVIGTGHVAGLPAHGHAGEGAFFVTEADDYKRAADDPAPKFLDLHPYSAIVTSIEHDHPDLYPTLEDCIEAFRKFIAKVNTTGFIVVNGDDANITTLRQEFPHKRYLSFGFHDDVDYHIHPLERKDNQNTWFFISTKEKQYGPFILPLPGWHNLFNATAAIITALQIGVTEDSMKEHLPDFETVERRFQVLGQKGDITVVDDYAHHPTAIAATLDAAKQRYPGKPIWCFFQPHTYSRTKALLQDFATSFRDADEVLVTDIFGSAREKEVTITAQDLVAEIAKHHEHVRYVPFDDLLSFMKQNVPANAVVITMGAGDIYKIGKDFLK